MLLPFYMGGASLNWAMVGGAQEPTKERRGEDEGSGKSVGRLFLPNNVFYTIPLPRERF